MKRAIPISLALAAASALTAPARAQDPPPVSHNVDGNGVDVVLGTFEMTQRLVSIGPDAPHGLKYVRMRAGDRWLHNFEGGVYQFGNQIFVSLGGTSAKFIYSGGINLYTPGTFSSARADGATLTRSGGLFTYTNREGIVARFTAEIVHPGRIVGGTGRAVDVTYPQGAVISINYRTEQVCDIDGQNCGPRFRIQSVTNNFSYQLHFDYQQETVPNDTELAAWQTLISVKAINTSVESCNPYADSCTLTGSWPVVSFGTDGSDETVTLPDNNVWRFTPGAGALTAIRRPGSTSADLSIAYDALQRVQSLAGAAGAWTYAYNDNGNTRVTTITGPLSASRVVTSDMVRQVISSDQDALGRTIGYEYDSSDRLTRITAPEGNYVQLTYDGRGNVTDERAVAKSGSALPDMVQTFSFPSSCSNPLTCNQPTSVTDFRGNTTDFTYDGSHGGVLTITAPAAASGAVRPQTRIGYTSTTLGGITVRLPNSVSSCQTQSSCTGAADEAVASVAYTGSNFLPTGVTRGNGNGTLTVSETYGYDDIGNLTSMDGPLTGSGDTTRLRYNALRQTMGVIGPDPDSTGPLKHRAARTVYDAAGLVTANEAGTVDSQSDSDWNGMTVSERVETSRDPLGRPIVRRLMSGGTTYELTQTSYDGLGRVQCVTQRMNPAEFASNSLPADACTLDAEGTGANAFGPDRIARSYYDAAGQVTQVRTAYQVSGQEANEATLTYRSNGQVETLTDAMDNMTTYVYDGHDRLSRTRMPSPTQGAGTSSSTDFEELTYETVAGGTRASPLVASRRLRDNTSIAYSYDNLGRLTLFNRPGTERDQSYAYDLLGRITDADQFNASIDYDWDALGRLESHADGGFGTTSFQYDAAGRRSRMTWPDGFYVTYDYDVAGAMTAIRENGATSGVGVLATYSYDDLGRRTSITRGNGATTTYQYDAVSRLGQLVQNPNGTGHDLTLGYTYNPAGQIVSTTRSNDAYAWGGHANQNVTNTINGLNQVTATGSTSVSHDANGNTSAIGGTGYAYDSTNRLTNSGSDYLYYDPAGRLFAHNRLGVSMTYLLNSGDTMIAEYDAYTGLARRFVHGPGIDEPLVWYEGSGTSDRRWLHQDERGSVIALSNGSGDVTSVNAYDEYGIPASGNTGRFQYTGLPWLQELGMQYSRNRIYSPTLGRFTQTDPIGFGGGMNLYTYVRNDPVNLVDPFGLQAQDEQNVVVWGTLGGGSAGLGGGGGGGSRGMVGGPTVSENSDAEEEQNVVVEGTRIRRPLPLLLNASQNYPGQETDETEEANERDIAICNSLANSGARSRCFQSANRRDYQRRWGRPVEELETRRVISTPPIRPLPSPRCLRFRHPILIGACAIITS